MSYAVKELFYTLQGEGINTGRPAVFCRFAGCNLWRGREQDRATAICQFCDTDFVGMDGPGGGRFHTAEGLAQAIAAQWPETSQSHTQPFVVCTGGEPLLQLDAALVTALHEHGFEIAIETNGTQVPPPGIDWSASARKPVQIWCCGPDMNSSSSIHSPVPCETVRDTGFPPLSPPAHGRTAARAPHTARYSVLPRAPALASELANA